MTDADWIIVRQLIVTLNLLDKAGFNDSPEADLVRDWCDPYWKKMTDAERERWRQISLEIG